MISSKYNLPQNHRPGERNKTIPREITTDLNRD